MEQEAQRSGRTKILKPTGGEGLPLSMLGRRVFLQLEAKA